uniref:TSA: Wollemia nobilis Ref_Wollemi_Transcript_13626_1708 transcribed RNA sequence n=1 Tax=Wollemia nobilis TaxID=56998 RepID=A0A0C9S4X2_9CONI
MRRKSSCRGCRGTWPWSALREQRWGPCGGSAALGRTCSTRRNFFQRLRSGLGVPVFEWLYVLVNTDDGVLSWWAYDPLALTWRRLPPMPAGVEFQLTTPGCTVLGRFHPVQCVSTPGKLVVVAGSRADDGAGGTGKVQLRPALERPLVFEAAERRWSSGAPFRVPRKWCICGRVDERAIYVASGCGTEWDVTVSKSAEIYDVEAVAWGAAARLGSSKFSGEAIAAVNVGGRLHMVSGKGVMMKEGAVYEPTSGTWSKMSAALQNGWTGPCVGAGGRFYVLEESSGRLRAYDPEQDSWAAVVESERLRGISQLVASRGKICGIVEGGEKRIVVVDVAAVEPRIFEVKTPMGHPIAIQVLSRMGPEPGRDESTTE